MGKYHCITAGLQFLCLDSTALLHSNKKSFAPASLFWSNPIQLNWRPAALQWYFPLWWVFSDLNTIRVYTHWLWSENSPYLCKWKLMANLLFALSSFACVKNYLFGWLQSPVQQEVSCTTVILPITKLSLVTFMTWNKWFKAHSDKLNFPCVASTDNCSGGN